VLTLVVIAGLTAGGAFFVRAQVKDLTKPTPRDPWFAPYVDATLEPQFHFEDPGANPNRDTILSFIVAGRADGCTPTWGTAYDLAGAATALDLDRRIERVRQRGGDVIVSFGGRANDELARQCTDPASLHKAYRAVIDHYGLTTVDFDIEGDELTDHAANARRARVVKTLQDEARAAGRELAVWLTLPVAPTGMTAEGVAVVDGMLAAQVDLAGVNLMTMDYGASRPQDIDMVEATERALTAAARQVDGAYQRAGTRLSSVDVWHKLGATPMIGQNDELNDRFEVEDARRLLDLVRTRGLGRVSMWSANRDVACGAQLDVGTVSNLCSGVMQRPQEFSTLFGALPGRAEAASRLRTARDAAVPAGDDPATSPYSIWNESRAYKAGVKVTWHRNVYEAKWYSHGDVPDAPVVNEWDTPWRYLGPVLPGDHPAPTFPPGTYAAWTKDAVYVKGDRVQLDDTVYEAQWWTRGERPDAELAQPWDSPWMVVEPPGRS
jgi:chitinase